MSVVPAVANQGLRKFFIDAVESAATNQQLEARSDTLEYVGDLLARFARPDALYERTDEGYQLAALADLYAKAVDAPSQAAREEAYRRLGDVALFIAGLFSGSLRRKLVDVDYYIAMGEGAYGRVAVRRSTGRADAVYTELSCKFAGFVEVLDEIGEGSAGRKQRDVLHTYEVWLRTGCPRAARKLVRRGVMPVNGGGSVERRH